MKWKPGERALGVTCRGCGRRIPLFKAKPGISAVKQDRIPFTCNHPTCYREHEYAKSDVQSFIVPAAM